MKKTSATSVSIGLAICLIFGLGAIWSQEKEKDRKKTPLQETLSIVKDKSGALTTLSKLETEDLTSDAKTYINLRMEFIEIRPSETKLISSPVVKPENGQTAQFRQGSIGQSFSIDVIPMIVENRGIELKVKFKKVPEMKEFVSKTVMTANSQPVIIELLENAEAKSKLAVRITPVVDIKPEAREYPNPVKELRFERFFLILNNDKLIAKGGLSIKDSDGEILPYFFVRGKGIYVLSFRPFEGAKPMGLVRGKTMRIQSDQDEFDWYSQEPILPEGLWRVWVRHNPNFRDAGIGKTALVVETKNGFAGLLFGKDAWKGFFTE